MAEYECFPIWEAFDDGTKNVDPDHLPVGSELKVSLRNWAATYDRTLNQDYPPDSGFATPEEEETFEIEGRRLWKELTDNLGPEYKVAYYSAQKLRLLE